MHPRVGVAIAGIVLTCGALGGCTGEDPPEDISSSVVVTESPVLPSPSLSPTWTPEEQAAIDAVHAYLERWTYISQNLIEADWNTLYEVAGGDLPMHNAQLWEGWGDAGWVLEGAPTFAPESVIEGMTNFEGTRLSVRGCYSIENSYLVDLEGNRADAGNRRERGVASYVVLRGAEGWYLVMEDNPEEGTCQEPVQCGASSR